jgi:hypothetical protein
MAQNTFLVIFAIINVVVVGIFAGTILRQYFQRRRLSQLYWSIALSMAFFATLAYILLVLDTPTDENGRFFFRLYYTLGAALTPAWLGLGSIALVTKRRVTQTCFLLLSAASLLAVVTISEAPIDGSALARVAGTPGTGVLVQTGGWLPTIIVLNTLGVVAVVGVAIYSGWKLLGRHSNISGFHPKNLLWANVLILAGDLCNAAAGTLSRVFGLSSSFWLIMALGWIVFYLGVLLTGQRKRVTSQPEQLAESKLKGTDDLLVQQNDAIISYALQQHGKEGPGPR